MKGIRLTIILLSLGIGAFGCGSSPVVSTSSTGSGSGSTTVTVSGLISIDNSATPATIQSLSTQATTLADGYTILATDVDSGKGTRAQTASGAYSMTLTKDATYVFVLFDRSNRLAAVVTGTDPVSTQSLQSHGLKTQAGEKYVVSAFKTAGDKSANAVLNETSGHAWWGKSALTGSFALVPVDKYVARANDDNTTVASGGDNGNLGKGSTATAPSGTTGNDVDADLDGLVDYLDPDRNGNGTLDALEQTFNPPPTDSTRIQNILAFQDYTADYEYTTVADTGSLAIYKVQLSVTPNTGKESEISKVEIVGGPSYIETLKVPTFMTDMLEDVPGGTSWKSTGYKLYKSKGFSSGGNYWRIALTPSRSSLSAGDIFTFRVTYTDGTSEEFSRMLGFIFNSVPKLATYKIGDGAAQSAPTPASGGLGTQGNPIPVTAGQTLTITWNRPKDEKGNDITGLKYPVFVAYKNGTVSSTPLSSSRRSVEQSKDDGTGAVLTHTFTPQATVNGTAVTLIEVYINAEAYSSDTSAQAVYFKLQ